MIRLVSCLLVALPCLAQLEISGNPPLPYAYGGTNSTTNNWTITTLTGPTHYGGTAAGSTLTIDGTSNGSPASAYVYIQGNGQFTMVGSTQVPDEVLTVNPNGAAALITPPLSGFHLMGASGVNAGETFDAFGGEVADIFRQANGTLGSPSVSSTALPLYRLFGQGWNGSTYATGGGLEILPTQTWSGTANGTQVVIQTTTNATTGVHSTAIFDNDGQVYFPLLANSTAADTGTVCWNSTAGKLTFNNTGTCLTSSRRFKHAFRPLSPMRSLSLINGLRPVSFLYNETNDPHYGVIAEEVAKLDPKLIARNKDGSIEGVKYIDLIPLLISAIQEQQKEIDRLKAHCISCVGASQSGR